MKKILFLLLFWVMLQQDGVNKFVTIDSEEVSTEVKGDYIIFTTYKKTGFGSYHWTELARFRTSEFKYYTNTKPESKENAKISR